MLGNNDADFNKKKKKEKKKIKIEKAAEATRMSIDERQNAIIQRAREKARASAGKLMSPLIHNFPIFVCVNSYAKTVYDHPS
jgi:hypothetical protein